MASLAMDLMHSRPPSASCCSLPSGLPSAPASCGSSSATWRQLQFLPSPLSSSSSSLHTKQSRRRRLVCRASAVVAPTASLYAVLGVEKDVSMSSIKSAYRRLALRYHPDVAAGPSSPGADVEASTRKFLEVQEAYEILSDPERRADYDFSLMHPFCAQALSSNFHMRPPRRRRSAGHSDSSVSSAWKLQWEAQISRLKQRRQAAQHPASASAASSPPPPPPSTSWGARVRWRNLSQDNSGPVCA